PCSLLGATGFQLRTLPIVPTLADVAKAPGPVDELFDWPVQGTGRVRGVAFAGRGANGGSFRSWWCRARVAPRAPAAHHATRTPSPARVPSRRPGQRGRPPRPSRDRRHRCAGESRDALLVALGCPRPR